MSKFFEELWESIFTPGPTPTLLIATNATFAVLQVVLFVLLVATYSIHFIILSVLSGGLWWAINWFARELKVARALQEEEEAEQKRKDRRRAAVAAATSSPVSTDSETEVEVSTETKGRATGAASGRGDVRQRAAPTTESTSAVRPPAASQSSQGSAGLSSRSGVSTEDEWEKVSENEK
ncbi:SMK killer toxin resistance protein [Sporothrix eucalyptigena]|uniref:SMK killer toxin resistance protein n=1 Tax=Sporothrix eucalyptigena TaxID=1812306 RepID=A0ABP0BST4_9PEZI